MNTGSIKIHVVIQNDYFVWKEMWAENHLFILQINLLFCHTTKNSEWENGLNPGVTYHDTDHLGGVLRRTVEMATDISTTCGEAIFRVNWSIV